MGKETNEFLWNINNKIWVLSDKIQENVSSILRFWEFVNQYSDKYNNFLQGLNYFIKK